MNEFVCLGVASLVCMLSACSGQGTAQGPEPTGTVNEPEVTQAQAARTNTGVPGVRAPLELPYDVTASGEPIYDVTHVTFNPDGTQTAETSKITASAQKLQVAHILAERHDPTIKYADISQDTGCASQDMMLFSSTGYTGYEICFSGTGVATLSSYFLKYAYGIHYYWNDATYSYLAANVGTSTTTTDFGYLCTDSSNYCSTGYAEAWFDGFEQPTATSYSNNSATLHVCQSSYGSYFPGCI